MLVVVKEVTLRRLEPCDPEDKGLLLATLWVLLANSLLGNVWESSDAITMVKYIESCICRCDQGLAPVVAMVSC